MKYPTEWHKELIKVSNLEGSDTFTFYDLEHCQDRELDYKI